MARLRLPPRLQPATSLQGDSWLPVSWNLQERLWFTFVQATDARQDTAKAIRCKRVLPLSYGGPMSTQYRQLSGSEPGTPAYRGSSTVSEIFFAASKEIS